MGDIVKKKTKKAVRKKPKKKSSSKFNSKGILSGTSPKKEVFKPQAATAKTIAEYDFQLKSIVFQVTVQTVDDQYVPLYAVDIPSIGKHTRSLLEKIRTELPSNVEIDFKELIEKKSEAMEKHFYHTIETLVKKYFPAADEKTRTYFIEYVALYSLGLGELDILLSDPDLEEVAVNGAHEEAWVFHRKLGWLKTNIKLPSNDAIKHISTIIGRRVGRQINVLSPLLDATLNVGDRVNATLMPISNIGNTLTIRKFASKPWTITDMLRTNTTTYEAAALMWQAVQFEMSILIAGGTASGKTSMLNVLANFFPPTQRVLSIEDTREIKLPSFLHWVPMLTRQPNAEGKGGVSMLNLLTNSLRQRPDRILVGEIRRAQEAEVLFEAMHTGHSVYATIHANTAEETVTRLTSPPINVPKNMIHALSLVVVQYRNRRTGSRRTFQIAEILPSGDTNVLLQYEPKIDSILKDNNSKELLENFELFTGFSTAEIEGQLQTKIEILKHMVNNNINTVEGVGEIMADFYIDTPKLMQKIRGKSKK